MAIDGITLACVIHELQTLIHGRVDKIFQPAQDQLMMGIRAGGANHKLLININAANYRVQKTQSQYENPTEPPMFCMMLRRRLTGGRIVEIRQVGLDRILEIAVESMDELSSVNRYILTIELMGQHSNIILRNDKDEIIDSIKRVPAHISRVRQVLPGLPYEYPPDKGKLCPTALSLQSMTDVLSGQYPSVTQRITKRLDGISTLMASEIVSRALGVTDAADLTAPQQRRVAQCVFNMMEDIKNGRFTPTLLRDASKHGFLPFQFAIFPDESQTRYESMSAAMDAYFQALERGERIGQAKQRLNRIAQNKLDKCLKKAAIYQETLRQAAQSHKLRLYGELINANIYMLQKGMRETELTDYTREDQPLVKISLDARLTPGQNAQRYFKKYAKLKTAKAQTEELARENQTEIDYLENQMHNIAACETTAELAQISHEMTRQGYIKAVKAGKKPSAPAATQPASFAFEDFTILAGKNNIQNDALTFKTADPGDIWLHAKGIPGSHVIIRAEGRTPSGACIEYAAALAARFSKNAADKTEVDFTLCKYVKKIPGARPGMVTYTHQQSVYVAGADGDPPANV